MSNHAIHKPHFNIIFDTHCRIVYKTTRLLCLILITIFCIACNVDENNSVFVDETPDQDHQVPDTPSPQDPPTTSGSPYLGSIPGSFAVSQSGAATYSIPLDLPPGINSMQPSLSLVYNSNADNGPLGVGWLLGGTSSIARCPKNYEQDGISEGVQLDDSDRFCLDGIRLVPADGNYGDYGADGKEYRTETDSLTKVVSYGSHGFQYFKVWSKDGRIMEYGNTPDSQFNVYISKEQRMPILSWSVNKISDHLGNEVNFSYTSNYINGEHYIDDIVYKAVDATTDVRLHFLYSDDPNAPVDPVRPDVINKYLAGAQLSTSKLLKSVDIQVNGLSVNSYSIQYNQSNASGRSTLWRITHCDRENVCKYPTTFHWTGTLTSFQEYAGESWPSYGENFYMHDFNGDGRTDMLVTANPEVAKSFEGYKLYLSTGAGFELVEENRWPSYGEHFHFGDFNGDGKTDMLVTANAPEWEEFDGYKVYHSTGAGFELVEVKSEPSFGENIYMHDFNGDGRTDMLATANPAVKEYEGYKIYHATGAGFKLVEENRWPSFGERFHFGDFNGDGKTDMLVTANAPEWKEFEGYKIYHSTESGFDLPEKHSWPSYGERFYFGDFNGDGKSDMLVTASAPDWKTFHGWKAYVSVGSPIDKIRKIWSSNSVSDNFTIEVQYMPITDSRVYTKYTNSTYPFLDVQNATVVVESVKMDDGIGGQNTSSYHYEGLTRNLLRGSSLGFGKIAKFDQATSLENITQYHQQTNSIDFWVNGLVEQTYTKLPTSDFYLSHTVNTWLSRDSDAGVLMPYLGKSVTTRHDLNGAYISTTTSETLSVDQYGNVNGTRTTISDGVKQHINETVTSYSPADTDNWLVGLVSRVSTRNTAPIEPGMDVSEVSITNVTEFTYNPGTPLVQTKTVEPDIKINDPTSSLWRTTSTAYDSYGRPIEVTVEGADVKPRRISTIYESGTNGTYNIKTNRVVNTYNADGTVKQSRNMESVKTIDLVHGNEIGSIGPNKIINSNTGYTTFNEYDGFGRKTKTTDAKGNITTQKYYRCDSSDYLCVNDNEAYYTVNQVSDLTPTFVFFNKFGRKVRTRTTGFNGQTVYQHTQYDALGRPIGHTDPYYTDGTPKWFCKAYDVLGRVTTTYLPSQSECSNSGAHEVQSEHIYDGLRSAVTIHNNDTNGSSGENLRQTATTWKNVKGKPVEVEDNLGNRNTYVYDAKDNLIIAKDPAGNTVRAYFDINNRKTAMDDPDMGYWEYRYNAMDELVWQIDNMLQEVSFLHDELGRIYQRNEPHGAVTKWTYDSAEFGVGKLAGVNNDQTGYGRTLKYNTDGLPESETTRVLSKEYKTNLTYNKFGHVKTITYPGKESQRITIENVYTDGVLTNVKNANTGKLYWQAAEIDAAGHVTVEAYGNGTKNIRAFDDLGRVTNIAHTNGISSFNNFQYTHDTAGNLLQRENTSSNTIYNFTYDGLNRLVNTSNSKTSKFFDFDYDSIGNITRKRTDVSDVEYLYDSNKAGPHAVVETINNGSSLTEYKYDYNGNMVSDGERTFNWTWFNKPKTITNANRQATFSYDDQHRRVSQTYEQGYVVYINPQVQSGGHYEIENKGGSITHKHYLYGSAGVIGVLRIWESTGVAEVDYFHKDNLGSIVAISNKDANITARFRYEPFGKQHTLPVENYLQAVIADITHHGYTGHEHLDDFGLIHMNARLYNPELGRFISADPIIRYLGSTQGFNRYAYTDNNPLSRVDLSGFGWRDTLNDWWQDNKYTVYRIAITAAIVAAAAYTGGAAYGLVGVTGFWSAMAAGALAGATSGAIIGAASGYAVTRTWQGTLHGAGMGAIVGGIGGAIGGGISNAFENQILARMLTGGLRGAYTQRSLEGYGRGMLAGLVPNSLGMQKYYDDPVANFFIGLMAARLRGAVVGGADESKNSVQWYLINNLVGHAVGYISQKGWGAPEFKKGGYWKYDTKRFSDALALGNTVTYAPGTYEREAHEISHINNQPLGEAYLPLHGISQMIGIPTGYYLLERKPYQPIDPY